MNNSQQYTNELIHETSPYLLQHAHNPVHWYPWSEEILAKAKAEDKPILISIGYAACHWCHVMEIESFEDEATAKLMNDWFINIKVDREERPDLDQIYMDAVQALNGNGGWPLNVFLTPEGKPFYGGTYFPPKSMYNRISWKDLLATIHDAYVNKKDTVLQQSQSLMDHLHNANSIGSPRSNPGLASKEHLQFGKEELLKIADKEWGGFTKAPKFPQTYSIQYLLRFAKQTKNSEAAAIALFSLDKMMQGGIYDHVGGGFSRYSTDKEWQVPHFEKMLYDNALLLSTLSEAFALTREDKYAEVIDHTIQFLSNELTNEGGAFYSSLDADSENVEGKFYVWSKQEIDTILGKDAPLFCKCYDIWEDGNWEGQNIIWLPTNLEKLALQLSIPLPELKSTLQNCLSKLYQERSKRIRPNTDTKILLGWNAMTITALCDAYAATGKRDYLEKARRAMQFLEENLCPQNAYWLHSLKNSGIPVKAFLDDYGFLIQAYIRLQEVSGELIYLRSAKKWTEFVLQHFASLSTLFFFTEKSQTDIIMRKKDIYDGATASGNSLMAHNLLSLSIHFDIPAWKEKAFNMLLSVGGGIVHYIGSFGNWALLLQKFVWPAKEIVLLGKNAHSFLPQIVTRFDNNSYIISAEKETDSFALLIDKQVEQNPIFYLCENYSCQKPSKSIDEFVLLLDESILN